MTFRILLVGGARPNFVKLAPLMRALRKSSDIESTLVHTGQHYDESMSGKFFSDLAIPAPKHNLQVGSASHAQQTAEIIKRFEGVVFQERPHCVVVVGDVNSTMACALVAKKLDIEVVHVEAGLRSFDRKMPEEINRVITDAISDLLLVTEESGVRNLLAEGVPPGRIDHVGNLMIDTLYANLARAKESSVPDQIGVSEKRFGLVTLHRPTNVDFMDQLRETAGALTSIAEELPLYFPVHPRTRAALNGSAAFLNPRIHVMEPLGYLDFLCLMSRSSVVLTDSGGIQEETTALGVPCLTLRENTERPITIEEGTNVLAGTTKDSILKAWQDFKRSPKVGRVPKLWDGRAAERCVEAINRHLGSALIESRAPIA